MTNQARLYMSIIISASSFFQPARNDIIDSQSNDAVSAPTWDLTQTPRLAEICLPPLLDDHLYISQYQVCRNTVTCYISMSRGESAVDI
jgi:hypothetical protein